ncbi:hypothetical protein [Nocardiopsis sp. ATB16-24]|uniref:hypothetical protein n=1 Tax=Nocardiopsis sp. ATB16-24 TaxID=3019555 RepID=UPI002556F3A6|nr:hypothetical protein [Nocardiopsis sp. ATB16-24]
MTAHLVVDAMTWRVLLVITVVIVALFLHRQGYDVALALLVAAAALTVSGEAARHVLARDAR